MRCVCLADFAHHFEPSLEAKAITSEPRRDENAGDASGEQRVNRFNPRGTVRASSAAAAPSRMPVVSPRIRVRIFACVFTVLISTFSLAIIPRVYSLDGNYSSYAHNTSSDDKAKKYHSHSLIIGRGRFWPAVEALGSF